MVLFLFYPLLQRRKNLVRVFLREQFDFFVPFFHFRFLFSFLACLIKSPQSSRAFKNVHPRAPASIAAITRAGAPLRKARAIPRVGLPALSVYRSAVSSKYEQMAHR